MKTLLLGLGLTATIITTSNHAFSMGNSTSTIKKNHQSSNFENYQKQLVEFMSLKISNNNEAEIKKIVLDSLSLVNEQVYVKFESFNNLKDQELKVFFSHNEFEKLIQNMYEHKMLVIDSEGQFDFNDFNLKIQSNSVWVESHWYWFGYWKLHFNHDAAKSMSHILETTSGASDIAEIIAGWFPLTGVALLAFSAFCLVNGVIFDTYDHGQGMWIGWYMLVPDMGWGSH